MESGTSRSYSAQIMHSWRVWMVVKLREDPRDPEGIRQDRIGDGVHRPKPVVGRLDQPVYTTTSTIGHITYPRMSSPS